MISEEQRREVARKLRFNARTAPYMNTPDDFAREVFRATMDEVIGDYRAAIDRLADLIDPDCRHESYCKVCGHVIPDGCGECPRCRSKVMPDDNR